MKTVAEHLSELKEEGITIVEDLIPAEDLVAIRKQTYERLVKVQPDAQDYDDRLGLANVIAWSEQACRAVTHPTALAVIRGYLGTDSIHFGHNPVMTVLRPANALKGTYPESGWHSDYPYHQDVFPADRWADEAVYAVQFNICIDEFRSDNGGTQFVPGSHREGKFVPQSFNLNGTRMGQAPFENVRQMQAPAGSALIYDARTWHRACGELNVSGEDRLAILNAVTPKWVRPMADRLPGQKEFARSGIAEQLADSVHAEIQSLCHEPVQVAPPEAPDLTPKVRSAKAFKL